MSFFALFLWAQNDSQSSYNYLRLPVSAHAAALGGDNITIVDDDPSLMFSNPALLLDATPKTIGLNYMNYMSGCHLLSASYNMEFAEKWNVGFGAEYLNYGTMKETDVNNNIIGEFSASDLALSGTLAYELAKNLSGGITMKMLYGKIASYSSMAVAFDLGLNYYHPDTDWSLSLAIKNLGGQISAYEDNFEKVPLDMQLGVSKQFSNSPIRLSMTFTDLNHLDYSLFKHLNVGGELLLSDQFYLALGYNFRRAKDMKVGSGDDESTGGAGLSFGGGINLDRFKLNLSYGKYHVSSSAIVVNLAYTL